MNVQGEEAKRLDRKRSRYRIALAVSVAALIALLVLGVKADRRALEPYGTLLSLESDLFDLMHKLDPSRDMYGQYDALLRPIDQELAELDGEYNAIPEGTVLYRRTGAFLSKEEYTDEDWERINARKAVLNEQKLRTVLPSMKRRIVATRVAEFHDGLSSIDLDSLRPIRRRDTARAISTSQRYLGFRQGLIADGALTDADGAILRPESPWGRARMLAMIGLLIAIFYFWGAAP